MNKLYRMGLNQQSESKLHVCCANTASGQIANDNCHVFVVKLMQSNSMSFISRVMLSKAVALSIDIGFGVNSFQAL